MGLPAARVIAVVMLLLAGGCTQQAQVPVGPAGLGNSTGSTDIEWLAGPTLDTASDDVRQVLVDAFERAYPAIKVKLVTGPDSTDRMHSVLVNELSRNDATPDVYEGDVVWPYEFAHDKYALPLSDYLPKSFWARFGPPGGAISGNSVVRAMSYHGAVYGIPEFIDEGFLYYRKDLLARAHLKPPTTWEQLVADAKVLKEKGLPYHFVWQGNDYEGLTCDWYEILADALGGLPAGASPAEDATEMASPSALKALRFLRSLIQDGISPQNTNTFEEPEADSAFDSGNAAFLRSWDTSYADAISATSTIGGPADVGVEPLPTFAGQRGPGFSVIGGWSLFVNPHTRNLRADLTFVSWMSDVQAQRIIASQYSQIPANASVRGDRAIADASPVIRPRPKRGW
jgi:multiple sugar transport system substrate-binding protein